MLSLNFGHNKSVFNFSNFKLDKKIALKIYFIMRIQCEIHTIHNQKIGFTIYTKVKYDEPVEMHAFMSDDPTVDLENQQ